jgi:hypothetical protein
VQRIATWLGLLIGSGGLLLQFYVSLTLRFAQGFDLGSTLIFFFTYYTILTNIMLVLIYLSEVADWRWLDWWRTPVVRGMMAGAIALVGIFNHLLLAQLQDLTGLRWLADFILHYITPTWFVLWWLLFQPKQRLKLGDIPLMLLPTLVWLGWAMARGAVVNEYPYRGQRIPLPDPRCDEARLWPGGDQLRLRLRRTAADLPRGDRSRPGAETRQERLTACL